MPAMVLRHGVPGGLRSRCRHHLGMVHIYVTDCVGARPHARGSRASRAVDARAGDAVFPSSALAGGYTGRALTAVPGTRRRRCCLMELLLVAQEQVAPGKTSCAFGALERLLLGMRPLMSFQMLEPGERALAGCTNVRARLVGLGGREIGSWDLGCVDRDRRHY